MIPANELRIGNWVKISQHQTTVSHIMGDEDFFEPIPLTPQILEKCWFRLHKDLVYIYKHHARIRITKQLELLLDGNLWVELKYLHQLQNLYFALTGEELNYTP